jgi:hypothetical protein
VDDGPALTPARTVTARRVFVAQWPADAPAVDDATYRRVCDFYYDEADLLASRQYLQWFALLAPDVCYTVAFPEFFEHGTRRKTGIGISLLCPGVVNTNLNTSGRNRQDQYGGAITESEGSLGALTQGLDPDAVGRLVLEAILDDQPYIFTDPALRNLIEIRMRRILSGYDWADKAKALEGAVQSSALPG